MAGPAEGLLRTPAFWTLQAAQQRQALERLDPRFAALSDEQFNTFLASKGPKYLPQGLSTPRQESGPDVVGRLKSWMTAEPPAGSRTAFGETDMPGRVVRALGDLVLPGSVPQAAGMAATLPIQGGLVSGAAKRVVSGALGAGGASLAQTGDPTTAAGEAAGFAGQQALGEVLPGMLRGGLYAKKGAIAASKAQAKTAFDQAMAETLAKADKTAYAGDVAAVTERAAQTNATNRAMTKALEGADKAGYEGDVAAVKARFEQELAARKQQTATLQEQYATQGAAKVAAAFKEQVPPWKDYPSSTEGLLDMVYGTGQKKLSAFFDQAIKDAAAEAHGKTITVSLEDAMRLKSPNAVPQGNGNFTVDAADVIPAIMGRYAENPGFYRRITNLLSDVGVGAEDARAAYKAGQALISFTDKTQMLKGETFHPDLAQAGFTKLKTVNELRNRGAGNIFEGPLSEAVRTDKPVPLPDVPQPTMPEPPGPRVVPPQVTPDIPPAPMPRATPTPTSPDAYGVTTTQLPNIPHPFWLGGSVAELPFAMAGQHRYGAPFLAGGAAASLLSGAQYTSEAPMGPLLDTLLRVEPLQAGEIIRSIIENAQIPMGQ